MEGGYVPKLLDLFPTAGTDRSTLMLLYWNISKEDPKSLAPMLKSDVFKEALFSQMTQSMLAQTLKEMAPAMPDEILDWTDDLNDALKQFSATMAFAIAAIFGVLGRQNEKNAQKFTDLLVKALIKDQLNGTTAPQYAMHLKNIVQKYPAAVQPSLPTFEVCIFIFIFKYFNSSNLFYYLYFSFFSFFLS